MHLLKTCFANIVFDVIHELQNYNLLEAEIGPISKAGFCFQRLC
jgi:hypothetical protein